MQRPPNATYTWGRSKDIKKKRKNNNKKMRISVRTICRIMKICNLRTSDNNYKYYICRLTKFFSLKRNIYNYYII